MNLYMRWTATGSLAALVAVVTAVAGGRALDAPPVGAAGLGLLLGCGAAAALSWVGVRSFRARVDRLVGGIAGVGRDPRSAAPADARRDELGPLARAIDDAVRDVGGHLISLRGDRARMAAILATMSEGVLVTDEAGRVRLANQAVRGMLHLEGRVVGAHFLELVRDPGIAACLTQALGGRDADPTEIWPARDPARRFRAHAAAVSAPDARGALLVLHDVTELRRTDVVRRDFVANVSHELRTPLTAIRGYLEALRDIDPSGDEATRFLDVIARHTRRMERLVQDLLRLARLEAGQEAVEVADTRLETIIGDVVSDLASALNSRGQRVAVSVAPAVTVVRTDCTKLQDLLRNLVENAVTYGPPQGTITIAAERADDQYVISVADEGPGIPEADRLRVFERFYRGIATGSQAPTGTGLGLAIVKHLAGLLEGDVRAGNRPGGGAILTVSLPIAVPAPDPESI